MKTIIILLSILVTQASFAEGVASMTTVTAENGKSLDHHGLAVSCKSQHGRTFVDLIFRPQEKTPFSNCSVTIYDEAGEEIHVQFDPETHQAPRREGLPDGSRVYFHVADDLVDRIEIMYHLLANDFQHHVFTIKKGELGKLAKLPQ